jgi:drug/metabolite transporter (DMT)-like permease
MSYIDPVFAILLSFVILKDDFGPLKIIGSVLILGATLVSELPQKKKE